MTDAPVVLPSERPYVWNGPVCCIHGPYIESGGLGDVTRTSVGCPGCRPVIIDEAGDLPADAWAKLLRHQRESDQQWRIGG